MARVGRLAQETAKSNENSREKRNKGTRAFLDFMAGGFSAANITISDDNKALLVPIVYLCDMKKVLYLLMPFLAALLLTGCRHPNENPNQLNAIVDFTIDLNTPSYYNLNFVGNHMYLTSDPQSNSRGIIVYRATTEDFRVYDRLPPNSPNTCCDNGVCSRLVVDGLFVVDSCNLIRYNILNGEVFDGDGVYPLYKYWVSFDGQTLRIRS